MARKRIYNSMKRLEIVCERERLPALKMILDCEATGCTVVRDVWGSGHHGERYGDLALVVTVVTLDHVDKILDQLLPMLDNSSGIVTVGDVSVLRGEYFTPECAGRPISDLQSTGL